MAVLVEGWVLRVIAEVVPIVVVNEHSAETLSNRLAYVLLVASAQLRQFANADGPAFWIT